MEKKLAKMQSTCKCMYTVSKVFLILTIIFGCMMVISITMVAFTPAESGFIVDNTDGGWTVSPSYGWSAGVSTVPFSIIPKGWDVSSSGKTMLLLSNGILLLVGLLPTIYILILTKDTFYNIGFGYTPFSKVSVSNLKKIAMIQIIAAIIYQPINSVIFSAVIRHHFYMQLSFNWGGIFIGLLVFAIAYIFDYVCELQQEHEETL